MVSLFHVVLQDFGFCVFGCILCFTLFSLALLLQVFVLPNCFIFYLVLGVEIDLEWNSHHMSACFCSISFAPNVLFGRFK